MKEWRQEQIPKETCSLKTEELGLFLSLGFCWLLNNKNKRGCDRSFKMKYVICICGRIWLYMKSARYGMFHLKSLPAERLRGIDSELRDQTWATLWHFFLWAARIHELQQSAAPETHFYPFPPSWLLIHNHHSQNHCLSVPPGSRCTCRPSLILSGINRIEAMGSHEQRERAREREGVKEGSVPGSEHSWWHGSRPASILPHQGYAHPGWMKRLADVIGNILQKKYMFTDCFFPFYICHLLCQSAPQSSFLRGNHQIN